MQKLNEKLVAIIVAALKGAKLKKFLESVQVINDSLAQGGWITRGSVKADSGFYQGLCRVDDKTDLPLEDARRFAANDVSSLLNYGSWHVAKTPRIPQYYHGKNYPKTDLEVFQMGIKHIKETNKLKISDEVFMAWYLLVKEKQEAVRNLNQARPLPKITPIGLSPKVTKTLTECNLDLDISSIKMAKIDSRWVPAYTFDSDAMKWVPLFDKQGERVMEKEYFVVWSEGIVHNQSRFSGGGCCHACGKPIPSGNYVPVEAKDKHRNILVSMWLGCDCAKNIFGIKDIGIKQN